MSKAGAFFVLFLALLSGLIASATVMKYVQRQANSSPDPENATSVVIATAEIPAGTVIRADQILVANRTPDSIPKGAVASEERALKRVAKAAIYPGEVLLETRLAQDGSPSGLPAFIPVGYRAITLRVNDTIGVAGFLQPGHCVDILTTVSTGKTGFDTITKVILQNVEVIATGQEVDRKEEQKPKVVPTVTVLVTLKQAEKLALAANAGDIRLVLRNRIDTGEERTPGVQLDDLISDIDGDSHSGEPVVIQLPVSEPTPRPAHVVYLHRGNVQTTVTFER